MSKKIIERDLRKDYGQVFVKFGEVEHITVEDSIQILDDFLNKRNIQKTEYWKELVEKYYTFYQEKFGMKPDFSRKNTKIFKEIIEKVKRSAEQKGIDWTLENAVRELEYIFVAAYADKWLKENYLLQNINAQFQKLRDIRPKEVMYFEEMKAVYKKFYKEKFGLEPDLNDWEVEDLRQVVEKLRKTAEQNELAWTLENAKKYLIYLLGLAHEDKWIKNHFLLIIINKHFQQLRDNDRARKGNKTGGRVSDKAVSDFISKRKAHTNSQTNT